MVYVFGIDLPLLEILLVTSALILLSELFLIWAYFKIANTLRRLERDIERFERALLKREERLERSLEALERYVKRKLAAGTSPENLKAQLRALGWSPKLLERVFKKFKENPMA